jgi:pimeloyl-ACP methyl ester carboxylesterase
MPGGSVTAELMADDAAQVLQALEVPSAHVAGFSGGSIIAQELALRHPELVRSLVLQSTWPVMDPYLRAWVRFVRWLVEVAPSERAFLEGFFLDIYTARAHNDGTVAQFIDGVLAFPHKQTTQDLQRYLDAFLDHDTSDRLPAITAPTLVLASGRDSTAHPELGRAVAELIPGARFEVMGEEAHQPFQEIPDPVERPRGCLLAGGPSHLNGHGQGRWSCRAAFGSGPCKVRGGGGTTGILCRLSGGSTGTGDHRR